MYRRGPSWEGAKAGMQIGERSKQVRSPKRVRQGFQTGEGSRLGKRADRG